MRILCRRKNKPNKQTSNNNKKTPTDKCLRVNKPIDLEIDRKHTKWTRQRHVQWHPWSSDCDAGGSTGYRPVQGFSLCEASSCCFQNQFFQSSRAFLVFLETVFYSCCSQKINVENTSNLPVLLKEIKHDSYFYLLLGIHCKETIW